MKLNCMKLKTVQEWATRILLILGCLPLALIAQERTPEVPALRVGVSPIYPPMVFKQGKELVGVEVDLAREFAESLGRKVSFVELPWEDQVEALNGRRIDIIMSSMSITLPRRQVVDFTHPYLKIAQMTLVRAEDQHRYLLGFPARPPGTIGVLKATTGEFLVQREFPKATRKVFKTEADAVQALKKKKIDLFISDSTLIWYLAGAHANDGVVTVPIALSEEQLGWGIRKGDEKFVTTANNFLQTASQNGTLKKVFRRWTAVPP